MLMHTLKSLTIGSTLCVLAFHAVAHAETPEEIKTRVLTQTKFNVVMAAALPVPISQYKGDGDPTTLELVVFDKKSDGPSRVSDDGEVIFFYSKDPEKLQQQLIEKAFAIRIAKATSGT
jgi:hypothetical protein